MYGLLFFMVSVFLYPTATPQSCEYSRGRVYNLIDEEWYNIQSEADFKISNKKKFDIEYYKKYGKDLEVTVKSYGYMYNIRFIVSFKDYFDQECRLHGKINFVNEL